MKALNFSAAQEAFILKQGADGMPVADLCSKHGIREGSLYNWKSKYGGFEVSSQGAEGAEKLERQAKRSCLRTRRWIVRR
jgi:putative transposase